MPQHRVRQGESILSLSKRYGIPADKILNDTGNQSMQEQGRERGILNPGDAVTIPELEIKQESAATDQRHRFRCLNRLAWLKVRFIRGGEPLANEPYVLSIDGDETSGDLDQDGWLRTRVPVETSSALVLLGENAAHGKVELNIGDLNPSNETSGMSQRLQNLGFLQSDENGEADRIDEDAIRMFQAQQGLEETGQLDDATRNRIIETYGC